MVEECVGMSGNPYNFTRRPVLHTVKSAKYIAKKKNCVIGWSPPAKLFRLYQGSA